MFVDNSDTAQLPSSAILETGHKKDKFIPASKISGAHIGGNNLCLKVTLYVGTQKGNPDRPHYLRMVPVYPMWDPVVICTVAPIQAPFEPCGSSWLHVYGTHLGSPRVIPCGLVVYGTHVGSPRFIPCGVLVYGTHVGNPIFIPGGLLVYGMNVGCPDRPHCLCMMPL